MEVVVEWEFQKDLEFLPDVSKTRSTFQSVVKLEDETKSMQSNYAYMQKNPMAHNNDEDVFVQLASSVSVN